MLTLRKRGLYCEAGDFYVDPAGAVERAVVTHAHSDHARRGADRYYTARSGVGLVKARLGSTIAIEGHGFGEPFSLGGVRVSFHPAGHILGSAQVRLECGGEVWVVSGDYKREPDPTCEPFEPVPCDAFVTEATFGTPAYRWSEGSDLGREIFDWWKGNREAGKVSVLCAYSLGKTQRVLGLLQPHADGEIWLDPAATPLTDCYRAEGVALPPTRCLASLAPREFVPEGALVVAPSSLLKSPMAERLGEFSTAFASGWMAEGGYGRNSGFDRGFVLSDHADWPALLRTVEETGARRVYVQHRGNGALVRELRRRGLSAFPDSALASAPSPQLSLFAPGGRGRLNP